MCQCIDLCVFDSMYSYLLQHNIVSASEIYKYLCACFMEGFSLLKLRFSLIAIFNFYFKA